MISFTRVISTAKDKAGRLLVKFWRKSKSDVQQHIQVTPAGIDSNPIKDMVAIFARTNSNGKGIIVGYMLKNQIAKPGETRIFSTNIDGVEQTFIYLTDTGDIELGGNTDNLVKFSPLNSHLNTFAGHISINFTAIQAAFAGLGVSLSLESTSLDISLSKADKVKTS